MALTKISTGGVKDDAVTAGKIPANAIDTSELASEAVEEGNIKISNTPADGKFLQYKDSSDQLTWTDVDLTQLNANSLTSGTLPDARFPATLPAASGTNLTNLPAANLTGTLPAISGANLTNLPPSGGVATGTASGAITAGQGVIVNSSGQFTKITETVNASNPPTLVTTNETSGWGAEKVASNIPDNTDNVQAPGVSGMDGSTLIAFDPINKVLCTTYIYANSYRVVPGLVNATGVEWRSDDSGQFDVNTGQQIKALVNTGSNTFLFVYRNSGKPYAQIAQQEGAIAVNSLSVNKKGSGILIPQGVSNDQTDYESNAYHLGSGKVLYIWYNAQSVSIYYSLLQVSSNGIGDSISRLNAGAEIDTDGGFYNRTLVHSTGKVICLFQHRQPGNSQQGYPQYRVGTVGSTSITWASRVTLSSNSVDWSSTSLLELKDGRIFATYNYGGNVYYRIGTLSGTSISWSSETSVSGVTGGIVSIDPSSGVLAWSYYESDDCKIRSGTVSSDTLTLSNPVTYPNYNQYFTRFEEAAFPWYTSTNNKLVFIGRQRKTNNNDRQVCSISGVVGTTSTDLTAGNFVGLASASYTNGQTATVDVMGGVNSSVSGLTAGTKYYVQDNGTIGTSTGTYSQVAGIALSSTKLLIKG